MSTVIADREAAEPPIRLDVRKRRRQDAPELPRGRAAHSLTACLRDGRRGSSTSELEGPRPSLRSTVRVACDASFPPDALGHVTLRQRRSSSSSCCRDGVDDGGHRGHALGGRSQREHHRGAAEDERREPVALVQGKCVDRDEQRDERRRHRARGAAKPGRGAAGEPWPCSSAVRRSRAAPSGPSRTWMSQRSYSPPRTTLMQFGRSAASMFASRT